MKLLVSVRNATEAAAARAGGADIIDAKEPAAGALGAVRLTTFEDIVDAVADACPGPPWNGRCHIETDIVRRGQCGT